MNFGTAPHPRQPVGELLCETTSGIEGRCPQPAAFRLRQTAANVDALACEQHAAFWLRVKRGRRVHPYITAEAIR